MNPTDPSTRDVKTENKELPPFDDEFMLAVKVMSSPAYRHCI